jgi:nucleotide-binding universal stress UspA family protein
LPLSEEDAYHGYVLKGIRILAYILPEGGIMPDVKRILFALELSDLSKEIVPWVNTMHQKLEAEVHVLHVIPGLEYFYAISPEDAPDKDALVKAGEEKARAFFADEVNSLHPRIKVVIGDPADEIIDYIAAEDISLVIIGTHGRRGLDRAIFGSVADRVLRFSPVPVMVVNPFPKE